MGNQPPVRTHEGFNPPADPVVVVNRTPLLAVDTGKSVIGAPPVPDFPYTAGPFNPRAAAEAIAINCLDTDEFPTIQFFAATGPVPLLVSAVVIAGGGAGGMDLLTLTVNTLGMDSPGLVRVAVRNANGNRAMLNIQIDAGA